MPVRKPKLTDSFVHMSEHMKWTNDLRRKVKKAVRYPIALLFVMSGVIAILMVFVVPKLIKFIIDQGFEVPLHTRALIATSEAFQNYWFVIFGIPFGIFAFLMALYRTNEKFAYFMDGLILKIPVIGQAVRKINLARFTHFFAVMFKSGIDIPDALLSSRKVVANRVISESVELVHRGIVEGKQPDGQPAHEQPVPEPRHPHVQSGRGFRQHERCAGKH